MFNTKPKKYNPQDPRLVQRFCEIHEISDWKLLPRQVNGKLVFTSMPRFWSERARVLGTQDTDTLLEKTPTAHREIMERDSELLKFSNNSTD